MLGSKSIIESEDLTKLEYTGCVLKESLRKWSPVPTISRQNATDLTLGGYHIPEGTWIQV